METTNGKLSSDLENSIDETVDALVESIKVAKAKEEFRKYLEITLKDGIKSINELKEDFDSPILDRILQTFDDIQILLYGFIDGTGETNLEDVNEKFSKLLEKVDNYATEYSMRVLFGG